MAENAQGYVTKTELLETKIELKEAFEKDTDEIKSHLRKMDEIVLPMGKWLEGIEGNTNRMASTLDETNKTNKEIVATLNKHESAISVLQGENNIKVQKMDMKGKIIVSLIGLVGVLGTVIGTIGDKLANLIFGG